MKKLNLIAPLLLLSLPLGLLNAADIKENLTATLKLALHSKFSILKIEDAKAKGLKIVTIKGDNGLQTSVLTNEDGSVVIAPDPEGIVTGNKPFIGMIQASITENNNANKALVDKNALALFKTYKNDVITLKANKSSSKTIHMIVDTTCPHCKQEIDNLNSYLDKGNVEILVAGLLGVEAMNRASGFYEELPKAKTQEQKIALLKKVFEHDYNPNVKDNNTALKISDSVEKSGVHSIPYIID
ncbi:hypothetical protein BKH43_06375 [Helicobacter sp. 13S00401-1]|uniref:hypothetical protein n=1 Tax=Helicobacter sp. 13S00401-1 TaxID=1905758 RepID=UPI000BA502BB|nr:hypothetical protein [Helicobacter sp. 13S00401-1]PAF49711.1 hypothetical protein BKH43_06375 [Helicobacter sp. 13S00401-1]